MTEFKLNDEVWFLYDDSFRKGTVLRKNREEFIDEDTGEDVCELVYDIESLSLVYEGVQEKFVSDDVSTIAYRLAEEFVDAVESGDTEEYEDEDEDGDLDKSTKNDLLYDYHRIYDANTKIIGKKINEYPPTSTWHTTTTGDIHYSQ